MWVSTENKGIQFKGNCSIGFELATDNDAYAVVAVLCEVTSSLLPKLLNKKPASSMEIKPKRDLSSEEDSDDASESALRNLEGEDEEEGDEEDSYNLGVGYRQENSVNDSDYPLFSHEKTGTEPLRPGDVIEYYSPIFVYGK